MPTFRLSARGRYSLAAQAAFLRGFAPALPEASSAGGRRREAAGDPKRGAAERLVANPPELDASNDDGDETAIDLAFPVERSWKTAAVHLTADGDRGVVVETAGKPPARLEEQVRRMLSLDVDGSGWAAVGERDAKLGALQVASGWLRPISFPSPYEAAVWGVLSQRMPMARAARIKRAMAEELGSRVGGRWAFPAPPVLAELRAFAGVPAVKIDRLRAVAAAALDGLLDGEALRARATDDALAALQEISGVGPFTAQLILIRGAGAPDVLPSGEGRLEEAVARVYGERARLAQLSEAWRPYRSWAAVLLRSFA